MFDGVHATDWFQQVKFSNYCNLVMGSWVHGLWIMDGWLNIYTI